MSIMGDSRCDGKFIDILTELYDADERALLSEIVNFFSLEEILKAFATLEPEQFLRTFGAP